MKNAALISFAIVLAFMPVFASASAGMSFTLSTGEAKLCSCSTAQITGTLTSGGYGVYTLKSDSKWITIAPDTISLGPDESTSVYVYMTTDCTSPPKDYPIEITARSDAGLTETKQLTATILPCHNVELKVSPTDAEACLEESAHFSLNATNNGKADEEFIVSTSTGTLETERVYLGRSETKTIGLDIPANDTQKEAVILIRSASTYAAASKTVKVSGISCHSAALAVSPEEKTVCLGDSVNYSVLLKNTGTRKDEFRINSSFGALSDKYISLEAGESRKITLLAQSNAPGNYPFYIAAVSKYVKADTIGTFKTVQCRGVEASIYPDEQTLCKGFPANYSVRIKNTGVLDDAYSLTSSIGTLENEKAAVPKGESQSVLLSIPANVLDDRTFIDVKAVSVGDYGVTSIGHAIHNTENCYGLNSTARSTEETICAGETVGFAIDVENTGKLADEYEIKSDFGALSKKHASLSPGEKTTIAVTIPTNLSDVGKKNISISISSKNANTTNILVLEVDSAEKCYGFNLAAKKDTLFTNDSIGKLFEINIENRGKASSNFSAKLDAPLWAYISPKDFVLQKEKNATVYVYAAPSYGTKDGTYLMKITVKNSAGFEKNEFTQLVLGNATPLDLSKLRAAPTGEAVKTAASPKSLYVIALGIIVIAIIIFGPRLFGKKAEGEGEGEKEEEKEEYPEIEREMPEELIGVDKTVIMEPVEEKAPEAKEVEEEKEEEKAEKQEHVESRETEEKKKRAKKKKQKPKSSKKELQDILDNV